jgi:hypothetical protein
MKKIMHWLNTLPEPEKTLALNYCAAENPKELLTQVDSLPKAIAQAFTWSKTNEGIDYWLAVANEHRS